MDGALPGGVEVVIVLRSTLQGFRGISEAYENSRTAQGPSLNSKGGEGPLREFLLRVLRGTQEDHTRPGYVDADPPTGRPGIPGRIERVERGPIRPG